MNLLINIKDFIYYKRKYITAAILFISITLIYIIFLNKDNKQELIELNELELDKKSEVIEEKKEAKTIIIDIKGNVNNPGTYEFDKESRVQDAINKAGGLTKEANTNEINLSEKLYDEMVIYIPSIKEETNPKEINITQKSNKESISNKQIDEKISINNGSIDELMTISGIGKTKAQSIIDYRNKNGKFNSIDEITNVSGIGTSTFEKIKNYIKL